MRHIALTRGQFALVDDKDYARVSQFKWYADKGANTYYARRNIRLPNGQRSSQRMHTFLLGGPADHINPNSGLDNRSSNIRLATNRQNQWSFKTKRAGCTSEYRGVSWDKENCKWRAQIEKHKKKTCLGLFESEVEAAAAYDKAAVARDSKFCYLNLL